MIWLRCLRCQRDSPSKNRNSMLAGDAFLVPLRKVLSSWQWMLTNTVSTRWQLLAFWGEIFQFLEDMESCTQGIIALQLQITSTIKPETPSFLRPIIFVCPMCTDPDISFYCRMWSPSKSWLPSDQGQLESSPEILQSPESKCLPLLSRWSKMQGCSTYPAAGRFWRRLSACMLAMQCIWEKIAPIDHLQEHFLALLQWGTEMDKGFDGMSDLVDTYVMLCNITSTCI